MARELGTIAAGASRVVDTVGGRFLTIITAPTGTAVISAVDDETASAATGHSSDVAAAVNSKTVIEVDWPFYFISAAVVPLRYSLV